MLERSGFLVILGQGVPDRLRLPKIVDRSLIVPGDKGAEGQNLEHLRRAAGDRRGKAQSLPRISEPIAAWTRGILSVQPIGLDQRLTGGSACLVLIARLPQLIDLELVRFWGGVAGQEFQAEAICTRDSRHEVKRKGTHGAGKFPDLAAVRAKHGELNVRGGILRRDREAQELAIRKIQLVSVPLVASQLAFHGMTKLERPDFVRRLLARRPIRLCRAGLGKQEKAHDDAHRDRSVGVNSFTPQHTYPEHSSALSPDMQARLDGGQVTSLGHSSSPYNLGRYRPGYTTSRNVVTGGLVSFHAKMQPSCCLLVVLIGG